jgi:Flp pilus assembly protein TadG
MGKELTSKTKVLRNRRGQSLIELALITPVILVALMVPVDFGIGLFTAHFTQNAVREGARIGSSMSPFDSSSVVTQVTNRLPALLEGPPTVTAVLSGSPGDACMRTVTVSASGQYNYGFAYRLLNLLGFSIDPSATITRTTEMRYEFQTAQYSNPC